LRQVRVKVCSPIVESVNASVPLVDLTPVHPLEAVQDSADDEDQDKSKVLFSSTELALEMDTVGEGTADELPPPQALSNTNAERKGRDPREVMDFINRFDYS